MYIFSIQLDLKIKTFYSYQQFITHAIGVKKVCNKKFKVGKLGTSFKTKNITILIKYDFFFTLNICRILLILLSVCRRLENVDLYENWAPVTRQVRQVLTRAGIKTPILCNFCSDETGCKMRVNFLLILWYVTQAQSISWITIFLCLVILVGNKYK